MPWKYRGRVSSRLSAPALCAEPAAGSYFPPRVFSCSTHQIPTKDSERSIIGIFEVFHEDPLEFDGYLLSCAKMPGAKESDPDCNIEIRMLNNAESSAQSVGP